MEDNQLQIYPKLNPFLYKIKRLITIMPLNYHKQEAQLIRIKKLKIRHIQNLAIDKTQNI
jgi:hypothetical protein